MARVHQKYNPERWYYWADKLGVLILQDMIQTTGNFTSNITAGIQYFIGDLTRMVSSKLSHPSIVQWEIFKYVFKLHSILYTLYKNILIARI